VGVSALRLSTGRKINRSADDPAGHAISNRLAMHASGIEVAGRNSSNVISMLNTADGALNEIHGMIGRVHQLSVAASNETNVPEDLQKIQAEIDMVLAEIDQTASNTEYNGIRLIAGDAGRIMLTGGTHIEVVSHDVSLPFGTLSFELLAAPTRTTLITGAGGTLPDADLDGRSIVINSIRVPLNGYDDEVSLRLKLAAALDASDFGLAPAPAPSLFGAIRAVHSGSRHTLEISGDPDVLAALGLDGTPVIGTDADVGNFGGILQPGTAYTADGNRITIVDAYGGSVVLALRGDTAPGMMEITTRPGPLVAQTGTDADIHIRLDIPRVSTKMLGLDRANVQTLAGAQETLTAAAGAINILSDVRAGVGAHTNRLEYVVTSLGGAFVDTMDSLSRIRDADMALEMAEFTKDQVIFQAGMAVLAQANTRPQQIVQLLT